ncbi:hypothetical protein SAMN05444050_3512 [Afipia sp. GAS231]|nr:hypothetical protein SAMN05444050_3512 [Afipia sp. GAS231]
MAPTIWSRENKPRVVFDRPWKWLLLPGVVIQWTLYTFPSGNFAKVVTDTRVARSLLMTYVISGVFYAFAIPVLAVSLFVVFVGR